MTESEWQACDKPHQMMRHLRRLVGNGIDLRSWFSHPAYGTLPRKWRCFLAACCWQVAPYLDQRAGQLIEFADGRVEAEPTMEDLQQVRGWFNEYSIQQVRLLWGLTSPLGSASGELRNIVGCRAWKSTIAKSQKQAAMRAAFDAEAKAQCWLIRDIFGDPFVVRSKEVGRSAAAVELASAMYDSRDFTRMPELGEILAKAGFSDAEMLRHCAERGPHVRGCWVVDILLGKA
jgi:hypothetical protein